MTKANKNGSILEDNVQQLLETYTSLSFIKEYKIKDIFGESKIDFKVDYKGKSFFLECKNQNVSGSVDQKLPYYIENIRNSKYLGHFVFIFKGKGIRKGALEYLKEKQQEMDFSIIYFDNLEESMKQLFETGQKQSLRTKVKPIIKWAGGKRTIMNNLLPLFPDKINKDYHEPFCGGISVACELYNSGKFSNNTKIYLNDTIFQLIYLYEIIKEDPILLITELYKEQYKVSAENFKKNKERYNELSKNNEENKEIRLELAALFLFLNKTGFNGVYRENQKGEYNVPFGKKTNVILYDKDNLYTMHKFLQNCILTCNDYTVALEKAVTGDFIYCDPPYYNTFNSYSKYKFDKKEHSILYKKCQEIKNDNVDVIVSNSYNEFVCDLYKDCTINKIPVKRVINSKAEHRGDIIYELCIKF